MFPPTRPTKTDSFYSILPPFEQVYFFPPIPAPVTKKAEDLPILPTRLFFSGEANSSKTLLIQSERSESSTWAHVSNCILPFKPFLILDRASLVAQLVKNPPAMQETWVWSLGWEDPLEKGKVTHSGILAWRIPWTEWSMGSQRVRHDKATFTFTFIYY